MNDLTITVKHIHRGQPGPYRPHTYEAEITITGERSWDHLTKGQVKDLVKAVVHPFTEEPDVLGDMGSHYRPRLRSLERISNERLSDEPLGSRREVWRARVETPFTD